MRTQLGGMFVGALLLVGATSLPELITAISSIQQSVPNLAAGNFFGSNVFNMFALAVVDGFYLQGRFLAEIDPAFALAGLLGLLLTSLGLVGNLARLERRFLFVELDALFLVVVYVVGLFFLYTRGIGV